MTDKLKNGVSRRAVLAMGAGALAMPLVTVPRTALAQEERVLRFGVPSPTSGGSVNPVKIGTGIPDQFFIQPAYDPLIWRAKDGSFQPGLALDWGPDDDENKSFYMKLRPGVTFSTGEPFNAAAVKNWLEWYRDGTGIFAGRFKSIIDIETPDDLTVILRLSESDAAWPASFTQDRYGYVISPQGTQDEDSLGTQTFGTGPYVLDRANTVSQSRYEFIPRDGYWNPDAVHWDRIVVTVVSDSAARLAAVLAGQVDVVIADATTADNAEAQGVGIAHAPYLQNTIVMMDRGGEESSIVGDVRVRQALMYAVDREIVAEAVFGKYGAANATMITPDYHGYIEDLETAYPYDPDKARALLAEAGYADGAEFDMLIWDRNGLESLWAQSLSGFFADVGVTVHLKQPEPSSILSHLAEHTWPTFAFFGQIEEPNLLVQEQLLPESGVLNPYKYEDAELIEIYQRFHAARPEDQPAIQKELTHRIIDQAYYLPYTVSDIIYFHSDAVAGIEVTAAEPIINMMKLRPAD